jgi:hypothetical protein
MRLREIPFFAFWVVGVAALGLFTGDAALALIVKGWPPTFEDLNVVFAGAILTAAGVWWLIDSARGRDSDCSD